MTCGRKQGKPRQPVGRLWGRELNKIAAVFGVGLPILPAVPAAPASSTPAPGVFPSTFDVGWNTLNLTAIHARSWNRDQKNTVRLTIGRVSGSYDANAPVLEETAVLHNNSNYFVLARPQASRTWPTALASAWQARSAPPSASQTTAALLMPSREKSTQLTSRLVWRWMSPPMGVAG